MKAKYEYRILITPDCEPYDDSYLNDWEDAEERRAALWALIQNNGVWGYSLERRTVKPPQACSHCKHTPSHDWEYVSSCWGFVGTDGMDDYLLPELPVGVEVPIYYTDKRGRVHPDATPDAYKCRPVRRRGKAGAK